MLLKGALYHVHTGLMYGIDGSSTIRRNWNQPPFTCLFLGSVRVWECDLFEVFYVEGNQNAYVSAMDYNCWTLIQVPEGDKDE